ncbi:MAG: methionine adenosyltransferase [Dehalococcoidia bacterium]|nr:methionine adenosyltransferase [Dehalococcoidia bacterium]
MNSSLMDSPSYFFTSESVTEGHPDKLCDQVSDGVLDDIYSKDPYARVACETAVTTGLVIVMGEITCECYVDVPEIVRRVLRDAGYTRPEYGFEYQSCGVMVSIHEQSPDISVGVDSSLESRMKEAQNSDLDKLGAGDQGMMVGYACTETPELMPLPISLAHAICRRLAQVRKEGLLPYLRPDGKSQVTVEYSHGVPKRVDTVLVGAQHNPDVRYDKLKEEIIGEVVKKSIPESLLDSKTKYMVNTTGVFITGGPVADTGVTGRKILVDTYGGFARVGGGAFSGKDPTKVDRSGAYAARYVAKNVVAAGLADRFELQVAYAIGVARPLSVSFETFGTGRVSDEVIHKLISKHFDLRPAAIIQTLDLRHPIYRATASYGHFGRNEPGFTWEKTDKAELLRKEAGLK